ncbi:MAG: hypothetical protein Q4G13_07945 [Moraxella sp.]|nr:hypothetical protein [Moraxella sp.]
MTTLEQQKAKMQANLKRVKNSIDELGVVVANRELSHANIV